MPGELPRDHADANGVRLVLCEQIDEARRALEGSVFADREIHAARKALKRSRAMLRLMRKAIPAGAYRQENIALRDAARPLSSLRDAHVLIDALDRLEKLYGSPARQATSAAFRSELLRAEKKVRQRFTDRGNQRASIGSALHAAHRRVRSWRVAAHGWREVGAGLEQAYRNGRKAMRQARRTPTSGCQHEWRKQTKYLWHQLQALEPMRPGRIGDLADQCHKLSDYLGDHHDFSVLRKEVRSHERTFSARGGAGALLAMIDHCRMQLREKALLAGARIYAEKPAIFTARLRRYWSRWQR